jgi:antitoxin component YwqK of YwqJK toxin-antitoxin module
MSLLDVPAQFIVKSFTEEVFCAIIIGKMITLTIKITGGLRMKRILLVLCALMLIPAFVSAEITRTVVEKYAEVTNGEKTLPGTPKTVIYSDSTGKEVAKELYDERGVVIQTIGAIPDGIVNERYEGGELLAVYNYKNGKLEGLSKGYFVNGNLRGEWNYKNGMLDGIMREYHGNGNVRFQVPYKNNNRHGTVEVFLEDGKPAVSWEYKDGMREGINKVYYENGMVHFVQSYKNDERNGITREYSESGKLMAEYTYKDGKPDGTTTNYYEDGTPKSIVTFSNGQKIDSKEYDPKGKLISEQ